MAWLRGTRRPTRHFGQPLWGPKPSWTSVRVSNPGEQSTPKGRGPWVLKELEVLGVWQCWRVTAREWSGSQYGAPGVCVDERGGGSFRGQGTWDEHHLSLVSFRVAPEAEPVIRRHHQREDRWRGRNEGKGRGGWSSRGWISSPLDWPLFRTRNLISDLLDIQSETSRERTLTCSQPVQGLESTSWTEHHLPPWGFLLLAGTPLSSVF